MRRPDTSHARILAVGLMGAPVLLQCGGGRESARDLTPDEEVATSDSAAPKVDPRDDVRTDVEVVRHGKTMGVPDMAPFYAAGCDKYFNCPKASFMQGHPCIEASPAWTLDGLDPPASVMICYVEGCYDRSCAGRGFYSVGGLRPMLATLVVADGGKFSFIATKDEFVRRFAPVESPAEAMAFVVTLTRSIALDDIKVRKAYRVVAHHIDTSFAEATPEGFHVHVFHFPGLGCGPKPLRAADYTVTRAGEITETAEEDVYFDPDDDGCAD